MQSARASFLAYLAIFSFLYFFAFPARDAFGTLDQLMPQDVQEKTGVSTLSPAQKKELEEWITQHFTPKAETKENKNLYLSQNIDQGRKIRLTDGSLYEIFPSDTQYTAFWITPFPLTITPSGNPEYPWTITNKDSGTKVKARQLEPPTS